MKWVIMCPILGWELWRPKNKNRRKSTLSKSLEEKTNFSFPILSWQQVIMAINFNLYTCIHTYIHMIHMYIHIYIRVSVIQRFMLIFSKCCVCIINKEPSSSSSKAEIDLCNNSNCSCKHSWLVSCSPQKLTFHFDNAKFYTTKNTNS